MDIIGKPTIKPFLFYTGKISGYITWLILILQHTDIYCFVLTGKYYKSQLYLTRIRQ